MKPLLLFAALLLSVFSAPSSNSIQEEWNAFKAAHDKLYQTPEEDALRLETYLANKRKIDRHNSRYQRGETSYTMAVNKFADWFPEELDRLNGLRIEEPRHGKTFFQPHPAAVVPKSIDWVKKGAVTSVKDQGQCGSCYAFSAVGALEGLMFRTNKTITDLSVQELVDCSYNYGCNGGNMKNCFEFLGMNDGIEAEKSYPYTAKKGTCKAVEDKNVVSCTDYVSVEPRNEAFVKEVVGTLGPVSIGFRVSDDFVKYQEGIYDGDCSEFANHGMVIVGYDTDEEYWLVKNSWGVEWGESGYVRVKMNKNLCGIGDNVVYPEYH